MGQPESDITIGFSPMPDEKCIGCGVCTLACPKQALKLHVSRRQPEIFSDTGALYERIEQDNKGYC